MNDQAITKIINQTFEELIPTLLERVVEKINQPIRKKFEHLDSNDLDELINSEDYRDLCRAAVHPRTSYAQKEKIITNAYSRKDKEETKRIFNCLLKNKPAINQVAAIFTHYPELENYYVPAESIDILCILNKVTNKKQRSFLRSIIIKRLYEGEFDTINKNISQFYYGILTKAPISSLIQFTKSTDYNASFFAKEKLNYLILKKINSDPDLKQFLGYYAENNENLRSLIKIANP